MTPIEELTQREIAEGRKALGNAAAKVEAVAVSVEEKVVAEAKAEAVKVEGEVKAEASGLLGKIEAELAHVVDELKQHV